jgi:tRNA pseudouridine13 synthase
MCACVRVCVCVRACRAIPRGTRLLYLHSYQSYIWNHVATKRLETLGSTAPVVGACSPE